MMHTRHTSSSGLVCENSNLVLCCRLLLCSRLFRLPGEQKAVLTIPKKNSRKVRRKVGISTTQHRLNFTENSQRQNQTHRTFSAKILKPGLKIEDSSWNCHINLEKCLFSKHGLSNKKSDTNTTFGYFDVYVKHIFFRNRIYERSCVRY